MYHKSILTDEVNNLVPNIYRFKFKFIVAILQAKMFKQHGSLIECEAEFQNFLEIQANQTYTLENFFVIYDINTKIQFVLNQYNNRDFTRFLDKVKYFICIKCLIKRCFFVTLKLFWIILQNIKSLALI